MIIFKKVLKFFDEFFKEYSKYFILNEKCELFFDILFVLKFGEISDDNIFNEKEDVELLKSNFNIIFQNFIYFLRLITKNNSGMVHLIANYFIKNNFETINLEDEYFTEHRCIEISQDDIKILFDNENKERHICKCPFLSIFLSNYRNNVKLDSKEDERQFLFSFSQNLQFNSIFNILYFFNHKYILYNNNENLIECRIQFYSENTLKLISTKTSFFEDLIDNFHNYILKIMKTNNTKNANEFSLEEIYNLLNELYTDFKFSLKKQMELLMTEKSSFFKKVIDLISLFHNYDKLKSIVPHSLQSKKLDTYVFDSEIALRKISRLLINFLDWKNIEKLKDIYKYLIYKILNQEKEGISQLSENEYSFNLVLYRACGALINAFCFNYSFNHNCNIVDSIKFFKKTFFESQEQIENFVDLILKDYFKFFGFIFGTKNNFFNCYEKSDEYFRIYTEFDFYKNDFTFLKYLFALTEKQININEYIKISNIENVYSKFEKIFNIDKNKEDKLISDSDDKSQKKVNEDVANLVARLLSKTNNKNKNDKYQEETNIIKQWENLFELLCLFTKDDSSCYWSLISNLDDILSLEYIKDLSNVIKNNKYAMEDLKNKLKEEIIISIISQGNLIDIKNLEKKINKNLLNLFDENNIYNEIIDEMTDTKTRGETKMFYLKDKYLKHFDHNNYIKVKEKSDAKKYISEFKKDVVKNYNYYFYNNSPLTFEFFEIVFEKVFLNKENFELIFSIFEKLLNDDKIMEYLNKKSIRSALLPTMLNYLQIFNVINTKSFIEFKLENKNSINKLNELLLDFVKNNEKNNFIDKDLEDNMKEVINQMNRYQLIYDNFGGDLSKLNKYDFNTNILEQLKQNQKSNTNSINIISEDTNKNIEEEEKIKQKDEKLELSMKKKPNNFMEMIASNKDYIKTINESINNFENKKKEKDEIICICCYHSINLKSFEKPYGKLGFCKEDLFYINSVKASIREELSNLGIKDEDNLIYSEICSKLGKQVFIRINSCGHYFHTSCFIQGLIKNKNKVFTCPICSKNQNTLIPPLATFHDKYNILKSEKLSFLLNNEEDTKKDKVEENDKDKNIFNNIVIAYLKSINFFKNDIERYESFIDYMHPNYKALFNYFENIFYTDGTTFHKEQQIDNMKNLILSLRVFIRNLIDIKEDNIAKYINVNLLKLAKGAGTAIFLYQYLDSYLHYINLFDKIALSLQILFDYDEIKETFKYLLCIFLPYFCFGFYYRKLIIENKNNKITPEKLKEKLSLDELNKYLEEDNKQIMQYLTYFLKKFCFIRLISDYKNKDENIINIINVEQSIKKILSIIDMKDVAENLPENDIKIKDIINSLFKAINEKDVLYQLFSQFLNFDNVINSILENVKSCNESINYEITHELLLQFCPIKFNFIKLDDNVFDFLLKYLDKKCVVCDQTKRESLVCLICGKRVCDSIEYKNYETFEHADLCTADYCYFIHINELYIYSMSYEKWRKIFSLYVDKNGSAPKKKEITNEFSLSHEKLKLALKEYVSRDFIK